MTGSASGCRFTFSGCTTANRHPLSDGCLIVEVAWPMTVPNCICLFAIFDLQLKADSQAFVSQSQIANLHQIIRSAPDIVTRLERVNVSGVVIPSPVGVAMLKLP